MSWQEINELLGLAMIDPGFRQRLLTDPLMAAKSKDFDLTEQERETLRKITAHDLSNFSQQIIVKLAPYPLDDEQGESSHNIHK